MWPLVRPLLFALDPERAHTVTLRLLQMCGATPLGHLLGWLYRAPERPVEVLGLRFRNAVGLAAGWDKDGLAFRGLAHLGLGHIELGTVTPRPQPGNPRPRIFRLKSDRALINRMGFPSRGADFLAARLAHRRRGPNDPNDPILGVNLGKNKDTPNESAIDDYATLVTTFAPLADYLVINVSSPNTPGLRALQSRAHLEALLGGLVAHRATLPAPANRTPLLVKLAPDLDDQALDDAVGAALAAGLDGLVATNTTLSRDGLTDPRQSEAGGASGALLTARAQAFLERLAHLTNHRLPLIACGGLMTPDDAKRRLDAGASLVQLYTGLIYAGPTLPRRIVRALAT